MNSPGEIGEKMKNSIWDTTTWKKSKHFTFSGLTMPLLSVNSISFVTKNIGYVFQLNFVFALNSRNWLWE